MKTLLYNIANIVKAAIKVIFKRGGEYIPFIVSLIVWGIAGPIIRLISPTAGVDDAGLVQALIFGLVLFFAACAFSWFALRIVFPGIGKFVDDLLSDALALTDTNTRIWASIIVFAIYFFGAIIILSNSI